MLSFSINIICTIGVVSKNSGFKIFKEQWFQKEARGSDMNSLSLVKRKVLECAHLRVSKTAFFTTVQTRGGLAARCIMYDCRIQFFWGESWAL
jgi:hypothetical protein